MALDIRVLARPPAQPSPPSILDLDDPLHSPAQPSDQSTAADCHSRPPCLPPRGQEPRWRSEVSCRRCCPCRCWCWCCGPAEHTHPPPATNRHHHRHHRRRRRPAGAAAACHRRLGEFSRNWTASANRPRPNQQRSPPASSSPSASPPPPSRPRPARTAPAQSPPTAAMASSSPSAGRCPFLARRAPRASSNMRCMSLPLPLPQLRGVSVDYEIHPSQHPIPSARSAVIFPHHPRRQRKRDEEETGSRRRWTDRMWKAGESEREKQSSRQG